MFNTQATCLKRYSAIQNKTKQFNLFKLQTLEQLTSSGLNSNTNWNSQSATRRLLGGLTFRINISHGKQRRSDRCSITTHFPPPLGCLLRSKHLHSTQSKLYSGAQQRTKTNLRAGIRGDSVGLRKLFALLDTHTHTYTGYIFVSSRKQLNKLESI